MKTYKIREGFSFVQPDRSVKIGGDIIDLEDDIAAQHAHKLELATSEPAKEVSLTKTPAKPA